MRISDWSSDVCSSDLLVGGAQAPRELLHERPGDIGMAGHEIAHRIAPELKRRARPRRDHRRGAFAAVELRDLAQPCAGLVFAEQDPASVCRQHCTTLHPPRQYMAHTASPPSEYN